MKRFVERYRNRVQGILTGFDRVVFRGTLTSINYTESLSKWLSHHHVLLKDFTEYSRQLTEQIKQAAQQMALEAGRPYEYLASSRESKEERAQRILQQKPIEQGLVCVLGCVEPCRSFRVGTRYGRRRNTLELRTARRQCLHLYFYFIDRRFGWMHVRVQTWLPFMIQVCLNGREYLARQMDRVGMRYERRDNCFAWIEQLDRAQMILQRLERQKWFRILDGLAQRVNPLLAPKRGMWQLGYYWTVWESEYATDVMFRDAASLQEVYPLLAKQAQERFGPREVLRFFNRRRGARLQGRIETDWRRRSEGCRLKHRVEENSIKMYDKQGSVLRVETTINNPTRFKVRRRVWRNGRKVWAWVDMRKGLADLRRRVQASAAANHRYLAALAAFLLPVTSDRLLDPVSVPVQRGRCRYRAVRPIAPDDSALFAAVLDGRYCVHGFRNRDLRPCDPPSPEHDRRAARQISRRLALLRAHGLIYRIPQTHSYAPTEHGRIVMTRALELRSYSPDPRKMTLA